MIYFNFSFSRHQHIVIYNNQLFRLFQSLLRNHVRIYWYGLFYVMLNWLYLNRMLVIKETSILKTRSYTRIFLKSSDFWKEKDKLIIKQHLVVWQIITLYQTCKNKECLNLNGIMMFVITLLLHCHLNFYIIDWNLYIYKFRLTTLKATTLSGTKSICTSHYED